MKKLVWVAGLVLGLSILYPNGISLPGISSKPPVASVDVKPDAALVKALSGASSEDKSRVAKVYTALRAKLQKDNGQRVTTTERWADVHANTLQLAVDKPGKYPGLDDAIEAVFTAAVGDANTDATVVNPVTPDMLAKLLRACDIVVVSAR